MSEMENTAVVRQAYLNFQNGDISALLDLFTDDIDWQLPDTENVPFAGKHNGRESVTRFFQTLSDSQEPLAFNPQEFIAQGDRVVVLGDYTWRVHSTGRDYMSDWAHVWTVKNGKLAAFKEFTDTAAGAKAYQKAAAA